MMISTPQRSRVHIGASARGVPALLARAHACSRCCFARWRSAVSVPVGLHVTDADGCPDCPPSHPPAASNGPPFTDTHGHASASPPGVFQPFIAFKKAAPAHKHPIMTETERPPPSTEPPGSQLMRGGTPQLPAALCKLQQFITADGTASARRLCLQRR